MFTCFSCAGQNVASVMDTFRENCPNDNLWSMINDLPLDNDPVSRITLFSHFAFLFHSMLVICIVDRCHQFPQKLHWRHLLHRTDRFIFPPSLHNFVFALSAILYSMRCGNTISRVQLQWILAHLSRQPSTGRNLYSINLYFHLASTILYLHLFMYNFIFASNAIPCAQQIQLLLKRKLQITKNYELNLCLMFNHHLHIMICWIYW